MTDAPEHDGATLPLPIGGGSAWLELQTMRPGQVRQPTLFDASELHHPGTIPALGTTPREDATNAEP